METWNEMVARLRPALTGKGKQARKSAYAAEGARLGISPPAAPREYVKSSRGTWGMRLPGNRAASLTRAECVALGKAPGPGND